MFDESKAFSKRVSTVETQIKSLKKATDGAPPGSANMHKQLSDDSQSRLTSQVGPSTAAQDFQSTCRPPHRCACHHVSCLLRLEQPVTIVADFGAYCCLQRSLLPRTRCCSSTCQRRAFGFIASCNIDIFCRICYNGAVCVTAMPWAMHWPRSQLFRS